jgi:hypothetical protein
MFGFNVAIKTRLGEVEGVERRVASCNEGKEIKRGYVIELGEYLEAWQRSVRNEGVHEEERGSNRANAHCSYGKDNGDEGYSTHR